MTSLFNNDDYSKNPNADKSKDNEKSKVTITEVSSKTTFTEVPPEQYAYNFTCKRCGNHFYREVPMSHSKFGGPGLSLQRLRICKNCDYSDSEEIDK